MIPVRYQSDIFCVSERYLTDISFELAHFRKQTRDVKRVEFSRFLKCVIVRLEVPAAALIERLEGRRTRRSMLSGGKYPDRFMPPEECDFENF